MDYLFEVIFCELVMGQRELLAISELQYACSKRERRISCADRAHDHQLFVLLFQFRPSEQITT